MPAAARTGMADRRPVGFGRADGASAEAGAATAVPAGSVLLDDESMAQLLPDRDKRGHKGTFGKVLVVAGSLDYAGAALLVCRAAGRAGAGLVTLAVPESLQPLFAAKVVEATTMALPEDDVEEVDPEPALAKILDHEHDALVIGPGLRPALATADLLRLLLTVPEESSGRWLAGASPRPSEGCPAVLDAEALRTLASADAWWDSVTRPCVLTPHAGEFARLRAGAGHDPAVDGDLGADDEARVRAAGAAAAEWRQVVVLKGARTVIAAPDGAAAVAPFENPALASGGTGDVLSGTIGALLAQGLAPYDAARLGVYLHGLAGDAVRDRIGDAGLLAGDLPDAIPLVRKRLTAIAERLRSGRRLGFGARGGEDAGPDPATG
ncbi:MAG: NAD(P)H-hydrate dehydratase [Chloroflexi bacterium RBG_16_72_14]|nr:MAG: NAD(P)H-hydrate dehydratase [Chloroflexi bacterium RBG_16_72_14]